MDSIEALVLRDCAPLRFVDENLTFYVYSQLGDRCATPAIVTPTIVAYVAILAFGVFGNVCTCLVIIRNKSMHSPTNYYLFSLAVSDLLMLTLGLPMELYGVFTVIYPYYFGEVICKLRAFLIEFTSYASILAITSFSVERWCAICIPLRVQVFSRLDRAMKVIIFLWIFAFIAALPVANIVVINRLPVPHFVLENLGLLSQVSDDNLTIIGTEFCAMDFQRPQAQKKFIFSTFFIFFLLPAVLITGLYTHIALKLTASNSVVERFDNLNAVAQRSNRKDTKEMLRKIENYSNNADEKTELVNANSKESVMHVKKRGAAERGSFGDAMTIVREPCRLKAKSKRNSVKLLCAVVLMFFLCWLPFHLQRLLSVFLNEANDPNAPTTAAVHSVFNVVFYISGYFFYSNSACNPILYNILSEKYRMAFCRMIFGARIAKKLFAKYSSRYPAENGAHLTRKGPQRSNASIL